MIQDNISKFYYSTKKKPLRLEDDDISAAELEKFSSDELQGDPEDITFEDHRKES